MNQEAHSRSVEELEHFLQQTYHAEQTEPVEYLLYNARQQMLNLFYPAEMEKMIEKTGFSPEADDEILSAFDSLTEEFDRNQLSSQYVQYSFQQTSPEGLEAVFYITIERNTGFVLPQFEWVSDEIQEISEEDYRFFNRIMRNIVLYQGVSEQDTCENSPRFQRYQVSKEFWDSVC